MSLYIKWSVVPPQFKFGYLERASGDVIVSTEQLVIDNNLPDWSIPKPWDGTNKCYIHELCAGEYIIEPETKWNESETRRQYHTPGRMYVEAGVGYYRVSDVTNVIKQAITEACTRGSEMYESSPARVAGAIAREIFVECDVLELKDE